MRLSRLIILALGMMTAAHPAYCDNTPAAIVQVDKEIPADTRDTMHEINNRLFDSMKDNRPDIMVNMFVEEGRTDPKLEESVKATYEKLGALAKGTAFDVLHEYYIEAHGKGVVPVTLPGDGENKFVTGVNADKGPIFISMLSSHGNLSDPILSFVYLKTKKEGWHLYTFHSGICKIAGKNPIQWYEQARSMYDKGWDVPAMLWMQFVQSFIRPAPFIRYEKEQEMQDFFNEGAAQTAKEYKFPFKATWVKGMPMIYGLDTEFDKTSLIPVIIYVTKNALNRGVPIQEEVDAITSKIEKIIPGITKCSSVISYRAFSEPPLDPKKPYKYRSVPSRIK